MENKISKAVRILDFIASHPEGVTFTEIQRTLWGYSHSTPYTRANRGWWCCQLSGTGFQIGLLPTYCVKRDGKWYRNDVPHNNKPFSVKKYYFPECSYKRVMLLK